MHIEIDSMQRGYGTIIDHVLLYGDHVSPRSHPTVELVNASIVLRDPTLSLPVGIGRTPNTRIAAVEALQLMAGVVDPAAMLRASSAFSAFMDGGSFHGGYGQRTRSQLASVVQRLRDDPLSRRALMTMWDPLHDLFVDDARDYPCTIALQFLIRNDTLQLHTHMRSNDVWRGLAYDVFVFTQLQLTVAHVLGIEVGAYFHHTTSLHIYESDFPHIDRMRDYESTFTLESYPSLFRPHVRVGRVQQIARMILAGGHLFDEDEVDPRMYAWYKERV